MSASEEPSFTWSDELDVPEMTFAEFRRRCVEEGQQLILLHGMVVDVARYINRHPGGEQVLRRAIGTDASHLFEMALHTAKARTIVRKFVIAKCSSNDCDENDDTVRSEYLKGFRKKPLKPGHSALAWARVLQTSRRSTAPLGRRMVSLEELQQHADPESPDGCWTAIHGRVYDISRYLDFHPGGVNEILLAAGRDATQMFLRIHSWVAVETTLAPFLIGDLELRNTGPKLRPPVPKFSRD